MSQNLLPIGTIVKVEGVEQLLMICGYAPCSEEEKKIRDYSLIGFPNGFFSEEGVLQVERDKIAEIIFDGYRNDKTDPFLETIDEYVKQLKEGGKSENILLGDVID